MPRSWEWLGLNLGKHAGLVALTGLVITVALGFGVVQLKFSTSNSDYLNKNDPAWINNQRYTSLFGGDPMAVLFTMDRGTTVDNLFTPANQAEMKRVDAALNKDPWVYDVISPLDAMRFSGVLLQGPLLSTPASTLFTSAYTRDSDPASAKLRWSYLIAEAHGISSFSAATETLSNPRWVQFVTHEPSGALRKSITAFIPNVRHALMAIILRPNLDFNQETKAAATVEAITGKAHYQNATTLTTGVPEIEKTINDYLRGGIKKLGLIAAIVMIVILLLTFRVRWRLLPFAVLSIGLVWGFGLVGYFGVPLTLATITALPVLMGVGMDYSIQMHSRIEEEVILDRSAHPIQAAARGLGPALLVVTFDAVFAFMAMWFAKIPAIRQFGSLMVIGIIAVCVCSIVLTLAVLGIREYKSPTTGKDFSQGSMSRLVVRLGSLPSKAAIPAAALAALIFFGGVAVEGKLVLQTDPIQWLNPNSPAVQQIDALKKATGSDGQIGIVVNSDHPFSTQTVDYVAKLTNIEARKYGTVLFPGAGLVSSIDEFLTVPGARDVPPTGPQMEGVYLLATPPIRKAMVAEDGHALNVIFLGRSNELSTLEPVIDNLQKDAPPPPGISLAPGGIGVVGVGLLQNLSKSRALLTYLALLFVAAFLAVRLRSLVRSLLSLVPVLVAVGAVSLLAVGAGIKLSPATVVSGPLVVAVCTEFTSLILLRFVEERNRGLSPRDAMTVTASRTGRAFMVSALTAVAGIGVIATSSMPMLRDFGLILAMNVAVALLSALIVLPPVLVWAEERGWVSRGLIKPVPKPIEFARPAPLSSIWLVAPQGQSHAASGDGSGNGNGHAPALGAASDGTRLGPPAVARVLPPNT